MHSSTIPPDAVARLSALGLSVLLLGGCASGGIWRVSVDTNAAQGNGASFDADAVRGHVAFVSMATNLAPGATNGLRQVLVRELTTNQVQLASVSSTATQGDAYSHLPSISHDARYVAFQSKASNLSPAVGGSQDNIYVRDRTTGATELVSVDASGKAQFSSWPSISADGQRVAFESGMPLVSGDTNGSGDVYIRDRSTGTTSRVSVSSSGGQANNDSGQPAISSDGRFVAFYSRSTNLVSNDTNGAWDVFVHDRVTGATEKVSVSTAGTQANSWSLFAAVSGTGRYVAFVSAATNLAAGDSNGEVDVFVRDRQAGTTERVSVSSQGVQADDASGDLNSWRCVSISDDGRFVAFQSDATNLVAGDGNARRDVFVHDRSTGRTARLSVSASGVEGNGASERPSITPDGSYVVFQSTADTLVSGDTNGVADVFMVRNPLADS